MTKRPAETDANEGSGKQQIVWMDQREHVIKRPDMYIGSINIKKTVEPIIHKVDGKYKLCSIPVECSPALIKFIDEAIVNCIDNQRRDLSQKHIKVSVKTNGEITVSNDGSTVPISKHEESDIWKPTVVFSKFLSGSNFDDTESRFTGGRNGIGIKATNAWSKYFEISICNSVDQKKFSQRFENNMANVGKPSIKSYSAKTSLTTIRWMPDYDKLGMSYVLEHGLDENVKKFMESRVYEICACVRPTVNVWLNDEKIAIKNLQQYTKILDVEGNGAYDTVITGNDAVFQVCVTAKTENSENMTIGFVNGVKCCTGTHIDLVHRKVQEIILAKAKSKSKKQDLILRPQFLKNEITIVMSMLVPNPRFTSQSKEVLDSPVKNFGFTWEPTSSFRSALERSPIIDRVINLAQEAENKQLAKTTKTSNRVVPKINKYDPATDLHKNKNCTLILTEGDSAKSLAVAGLSVVGRKQFGVFPLRGKFMNVSKFTPKKMMENAEVSNLMAILGLEYGKVYDATTIQQLPYRRMVIFSDQDIDGSHIAGLLMNFVHTNHRSVLVHWPDFIERFATPIVRLTSGPEKIGFFSIQEYKTWKESHPNSNPSIKYYKGLGTSTSKDAKDYFSNWDAHVTKVNYSGLECDNAINTFFDEKLSNERKIFLSNKYSSDSYVDYSKESTNIHTFIYDEMSHFSHSDNIRSIPSAVDGLKPVQRKTLFTFTSKNQTTEMKVAQAGAMVAEYTSYHHGETSVMEAIVGLAQDHVGTNNIALLRPEGQFGSRQNKPSEHAAPRYIFTCLNAIARKIYRNEDDAILEYVDEDGKQAEPTYFVPIIPMALINGQVGIGTGWSTSCPNFSPMDVVEKCLKLVEDKVQTTDEMEVDISEGSADQSHKETFAPWYANFNGSIVYEDGSFKCTGIFSCNSATKTINVTELPIGTWTEDFIKYVREKLVSNTNKEFEASSERFVKNINNYSTDTRVRITLECFTLPDHSTVEKLLKMNTKLSTTNIHLFDKDYHLKLYSPDQILKEHASIRLDTYVKRRLHVIEEAKHKLLVAKNKKRFILEIINDELVIKNMNHDELNNELESRNYDKICNKSDSIGYSYLLKMNITSMTIDKVRELEKELLSREDDLKKAEICTPRGMWKKDLLELKVALDVYFDEKKKNYEYESSAKKNSTIASKKRPK